MAIDGCVFLGRDETTGVEIDRAQLLARLDDLKVDAACVLSPRAIWFDQDEGNEALRAACAAAPDRLLPVGVVNLLRVADPDATLARLKAQGFVAAALVCDVFGWSLNNYSAGAVAQAAGRAGLPLMLCVRDRRDLPAVALVARQAAPTTVLLRWMRGSGYTVLPDLVALMRDHPNIVLDVGFATQTGIVAWLVRTFGADRFYLGSGLPNAHAGAPWFLLRAAELDASSRLKIAGGTLGAKLGIDRPATFPDCPRWTRLRDAPKIDTHWHTSPWNIIEPETDFAALSRSIARNGIRLAITSSVRALSDDLEKGNDETAAFLDAEPRARGLVVVNPLQPERSIAELARFRDDPRFVGAKTIQDFYGMALDDARYAPILAHLAQLQGWPLMAHLPGMRQAAQRHPTLDFVAAHSTWRHRELAPLANVWFDIATSTPLVAETDIADLLKAVGSARVLFSSDAPLMDPAWTLGKLAFLGLENADYDRIFATNALRAFPRLAAPGPAADTTTHSGATNGT
jgi:uncharacterized protein